MKIGIGVTTYYRHECLNLFLEQLGKNPPAMDFMLHVAQNINNVAKAKNACLSALKDCDYIFLFDDDCFPISPGWDMWFINSGAAHLLYMDDSYGPEQRLPDITRYKDCSGCFMFITQEVFKKVGYFNSAYEQYGYEHMGYSQRIKYATKDWAFLCLNNTKDLIYSLDLQGSAGWNVHHSKSILPQSAQSCKANNAKIYEAEINSDKLYYDA